MTMSMNVKPWNQLQIAFWGAVLSGAYVGVTEALHPGEILSGAIAGALVCGLFAAARNWMVSRN
jgi:hypothetical protein